MTVKIEEIEAYLDRLFVDATGASLRSEERKKARELAGVLDEIERAIDRVGRSRDVLRIVDAAAGKAYVGLATVSLVLAPRARRAIVRAIERAPERVRAIDAAARKLGVDVEATLGDVGDPASWPEGEIDLAVALHACGDASDLAIERATAARARWILVAPCCVAGQLPSAQRAEARAEAMGMPRAGEVRRAFVEAWVMGERVLELESRGWRTEVVAFAPPTVTPYRLMLRAERVGEPVRMEEMRERLARLRSA
jgi:hypothetical protein